MRTEDVSYNVKLWVRVLMGENALTAWCPLSERVVRVYGWGRGIAGYCAAAVFAAHYKECRHAK